MQELRPFNAWFFAHPVLKSYRYLSKKLSSERFSNPKLTFFYSLASVDIPNGSHQVVKKYVSDVNAIVIHLNVVLILVFAW